MVPHLRGNRRTDERTRTEMKAGCTRCGLLLLLKHAHTMHHISGLFLANSQLPSSRDRNIHGDLLLRAQLQRWFTQSHYNCDIANLCTVHLGPFDCYQMKAKNNPLPRCMARTHTCAGGAPLSSSALSVCPSARGEGGAYLFKPLNGFG